MDIIQILIYINIQLVKNVQNINDNKCTEYYSNYTLINNNCYKSNDLIIKCENGNLKREKNKCIYYCYNDDKYKYEYNNIFYNLSLERTNISSKNKYLCEKECTYDNDKKI